MVHFGLSPSSLEAGDRPRVCAVSYLNTVPLVWGMLRGPQRGELHLDFRLPSECADRLAAAQADIGIIPCAELHRLKAQIIPGTGIASNGAVRSILLVSRLPFAHLKSLAADASSRTSVQLCRILLARRYGCQPAILTRKPEISAMLEEADAALLIGDPALRLDLSELPFHVLDLGAEWTHMTGLPMVFAVWAARNGFALTPHVSGLFEASYLYGAAHMDLIVRESAALHGVSEQSARQYLTKSIVYKLGPREYQGMDLFLRYVAELDTPNESGVDSAGLQVPLPT